jgi:hypothetical protein
MQQRRGQHAPLDKPNGSRNEGAKPRTTGQLLRGRAGACRYAVLTRAAVAAAPAALLQLQRWLKVPRAQCGRRRSLSPARLQRNPCNVRSCGGTCAG